MKDILKYSIWSGLYLTLIIPFIVASNMFFPYIVGKAFTFRLMIAVLFVLFSILILKYKEFRPKVSYLFYSVLAFIFVLLMASILAVAPHKAFWSNFERMEGFVTFAHLFVYFMVLISMFNTEKSWLWFLRFNVFTGVVLAISSIDKATEIRFSGPLGNPIYIAVYFLFIFFFTLILLYKDVLAKNLTNWKIFKKVFVNILFYIYLFVSILSTYVIYRTSRGALLGLIGGLLVAMIAIAIFEKPSRLHSGEGKKVIRHIALIGIVAVFALVIVFLGVRDTNYVKNNSTLSRLAEVSWSNINGQARQLVWPMAIKGYKEKPILGYGLEGFNYVFNTNYDPRMHSQETWFDRSHNAPLDFLVAGGLLGLLSYLALFISALYLLWFKKNPSDPSPTKSFWRGVIRAGDIDISERGLLTGLLAGYFFQAIFVFDNLVSYIMFFTSLAYIHSRITEKQEHKNNNGYLSTFIQDEEYQNYILIPLIIIIISVGAWWVNIPAISANKTLINALRLVQVNKFPEALLTFEKALSYKSLGDSEIREQLIASSLKAIKSETTNTEIKQKFYDLTLAELEKQIERVPNDARYYILTGSFLANVGNYEKAITYIEQAVKLSPNKQQMRFQLISVLYSLGRKEEALAQAKYTHELEPNYEQAKTLYETLLKEVSKK